MTTNAAPALVLEIDDVHVYYGAIHALKGVSISIERPSGKPKRTR